MKPSFRTISTACNRLEISRSRLNYAIIIHPFRIGKLPVKIKSISAAMHNLDKHHNNHLIKPVAIKKLGIWFFCWKDSLRSLPMNEHTSMYLYQQDNGWDALVRDITYTFKGSA